MSHSTALVFALVASVSSVALADDTKPAIDQVALRQALAQQRAINLARFHQYRKKGIYPHNTYQPGMLNVWKDNAGHLCAVATLIHDAGLDEVVEATANDANFVRIADLTKGPVVDWILTSGLTQEEAVIIQQPTEEDVAAMDAQYRREKRKLAREQKREDERLAEGYVTIERALKQSRIADAGLDLAVARLAQRPDLAAQVLASAPAPAEPKALMRRTK